MAGTVGTKSALFFQRQAGGMFSITDEAQTQGAKWFVDSNATEGANVDGAGQNPNAACLTLEYCITEFAQPGDTIFVLPGHNEDSDAVLFDADVVGLRIIGIGDGTRRPRFDFNNAASTIDIGANSVMLKNLTFLASAPSVLIGVDIEANVTDTIIENCEWLDAETAGDEFVVGVDLKGGNHQTVIHDNILRTEVAAGASTTAINIAAASNRVRITKNIINGNYSTGGIVDAAAGDAYYIAHNDIKVGDGLPGISLQATSTGSIRHNLIESTGLAVDAMIVAADCAWYDNKGVDVDGTQCQIIGQGAEEKPSHGAQGAGLNFYVDSVNGGVGNTGTSWSDAFDDLEEAIGACTHDQGDVIHLAPFHNETVGGAAAIDVVIRGVTIVSHGEGWMAPTFNFDTNTDTFQVDAAGCVIDGVHFIGAVADLATALNLTGNADTAHIRNCEFLDTGAGTEMLVAIRVGVNADRVIIEDNRFYTTAGGDATDAILFTGAADRPIIRRNIFVGDWESAVVDGSAGTQVDLTIDDNRMNTADGTTGLVINLANASTGSVTNNRGFAGLSAIDPIAAEGCLVAGNEVTQNVGVTATGALGIEVVRASSTIAQTGVLPKFTIAGGRVLVTAIIGEVDTANIGANGSNLSLEHNPTAGQTQTLCAVVAHASDVIGTFYGITGDPAVAMFKVGSVMQTGLILGPGVIDERCSGNNTGQIQWTLYFKAIDVGATVVVA